MVYKDRYKEFEQYLTSGKPGVEERARNWSIAIGLQDVDGLKVSPYLLDTARIIPDKPNDPNQKYRKKQ